MVAFLRGDCLMIAEIEFLEDVCILGRDRSLPSSNRSIFEKKGLNFEFFSIDRRIELKLIEVEVVVAVKTEFRVQFFSEFAQIVFVLLVAQIMIEIGMGDQSRVRIAAAG